MIKSGTLGVAVGGTWLAAYAAPTQWSGNGHWYDIVTDPGITWADANAAVPAGWHLATLTSADENQWVFDTLVAPTFGTDADAGVQAWLGGYTTDPDGSTTDKNAWAWVTGEPWAYTNWGVVEPNGDSSGLTINRLGDWTWNDEGAWIAGVKGYVIEKSVPDGGTTVSLLGLALAGLALTLKRKS